MCASSQRSRESVKRPPWKKGCKSRRRNSKKQDRSSTKSLSRSIGTGLGSAAYGDAACYGYRQERVGRQFIGFSLKAVFSFSFSGFCCVFSSLVSVLRCSRLLSARDR